MSQLGRKSRSIPKTQLYNNRLTTDNAIVQADISRALTMVGNPFPKQMEYKA